MQKIFFMKFMASGEDVQISPRRVVTFRAGQKLKARVF